MRAGLIVSHAEQTMSAVSVPDAVAAHLQLPAGSPVMRMERAYFSAGGDPIEATTAYYHPERYRFAVRLLRRDRAAGQAATPEPSSTKGSRR
jgi:GntR family transcriptional regulator